MQNYLCQKDFFLEWTQTVMAKVALRLSIKIYPRSSSSLSCQRVDWREQNVALLACPSGRCYNPQPMALPQEAPTLR